MKQKVTIVAGDEGFEALEPVFEGVEGVVLERLSDPQEVSWKLVEAPPELLVLVHPLPGVETVEFWQEVKRSPAGERLPQTLVVARPEDLFELEPLYDDGVRFVNFASPADEIENTLSAQLRKAPRPDARVMVKVGVELGTGKVLRIAQTVNVSRSGLLIRTTEQFPPGSTLDLKMELPGEKQQIEARAEVVRAADPVVESVRGLGARFIWFRGGDEERFDAFMKDAERRSAETDRG